MPFFLIPLAIAAKAAIARIGAAAAHSAAARTAAGAFAHNAAVHSAAGAAGAAAQQAAVTRAAHIPTHGILQMRAHIGETQVLPAAIATGSIISAAKILRGAALSGIVFLDAVGKYRDMHYLDLDGRRKERFSQIEH